MTRPDAGDLGHAAAHAGGREPRGAALLLAAALVLASWSAIAWQAGGFGIDVPWGRLSSRDPLRPLALAAVCTIVLLWWRGSRGLGSASHRVTAGLLTMAPAGAALAAALVCWAGLAYGTHVARGADPYGYVSQAELWLRGTLTVDFSALAPLPWRDVEWTLSPLGYRPGLEPYTIVPTYSPGLPMLMAAAQGAFGASAMYAVVPLCAAAAVWLTYRLGTQLYDRLTGLIAAALLAASPAFLYQTMWPMSDVPAAAFWTLALVGAGSRRRFAPLGAGLAATVAVLIRPNLAPLAAVPALLLFAGDAGDIRHRLRALGVFAAALVPGVAAVALLNEHWYGSPLTSGYGRYSALYAAGHFWANAGRYSRWLVETQTTVVLLAVVPLIGRTGPQALAIRRPLVRCASALFILLLCALYFFYLVFDDWWYLRFFLPGFPLLLVLTAAGLRDVLHRLEPAAGPAAVLIAAALAASMVHDAAARAAFALRPQEHAYVEVVRGAAESVPQNGVILAMQHSGSVRYYAGRLTLRYDQLPARALDTAVAALEARGRRVFVLLEPWEQPAFVRRFSSYSCRGRLDWRPAREWSGARLYDLSAAPCAATPRSGTPPRRGE